MRTTTLFKYIQSELIQRGLNEIMNDEGELVFFNEDYQFMTKIIKFDDDVREIVNHLFFELALNDPEYDHHFKKTFTLRFLNRQINRQTIDAFKVELMNVFLTNEFFINEVYEGLEKYTHGTTTTDQENKQENDGTTTTDNRQAFSELPQNQINIDVDNTELKSANENTISRNKQTNKQLTDGQTRTENKQFQMDQLIQSSEIMEQIFIVFDQKCFLQVY